MGVSVDEHGQALVYEVMMAGMGEMNRRDFGLGAAMFAAMSEAAMGQEPGAGTMGQSRVMNAEMVKRPSGQLVGALPSGIFATGEAVKMHLSEVPAGTPKVEPHVIKHTELVALFDGTVSFEHDGVVEEAKPGAMIYVAYGTNHRIWNSGPTMAKYCVIQIGGDAKV